MRNVNFTPIVNLITGAVVVIIGIIILVSHAAQQAEEEKFMSTAIPIDAICVDVDVRYTRSGKRTTTHYDAYFSYEYADVLYEDRLIKDAGNLEIGAWYEIYIDPNDPGHCDVPYSESYHSSQTLAGGITLGLGAVVLLIGVLRVIFRRGRISGEDSTKYPPVAAVAAGAVGSGNSPYPAYSSGKTFDTYSAPPESLTENSGAYTGYYNAPVDNSAYNTDTTSFGAAPPSDPYNTQGGYNASSPYGAQPAAAPYNTQGGSVGGNTGFAGGGNASPSNNFGIRPDADPFAVQSGSVGGTGFADGGNTSSPNNFGIRPDADPFEGQGGYNGGNTDGGYGSSLYGIRPDADPFAGQSGFNSDQPDNF